MDKSLEWINYQIVTLEDSLQHYTMVEPDKIKEAYIKHDLECLYKIKEELEIIRSIKPYVIKKPDEYSLRIFNEDNEVYDNLKKLMEAE